MVEHLVKRFQGLADQAEAVAKTKHTEYRSFTNSSYETLDSNILLGWCVKVRTLLVNACGKDSEHFKSFVVAEEARIYEGDLSRFSRLCAVFLAAREDFEGGHLTSVKRLVEAEVFSSELDQARQLLSSGYLAPAAVVAGVVLETAIRNLCAAQDMEIGKLDKMNADLVKAGEYNTLVQKRVTALAAIRNSAAHGNQAEFNQADVKSMIDEIERLVAGWLG